MTTTSPSLPDTTNATPERPSRLWWWFIAAFLVQAAAWTAWFTIAAQHRVAEVPLVGSPSKAISDKR